MFFILLRIFKLQAVLLSYWKMSENSGASDDSEHDQLQQCVDLRLFHGSALDMVCPALGHFSPAQRALSQWRPGNMRFNLVSRRI